VAPLLFVPLFLTALTGIGYQISGSFGAADAVGDFMMYIHQGKFLGDRIGVFYVLLNGLAVITMLFSGIVMTGIFQRR
jgi:hypothetical protein